MEENKFALKENKENILDAFLNKYFSTNTDKTIEINRDKISNLIEKGENVENILLKIVEKGYLLHGSDNGNVIEFLPTEPNDLGMNKDNLKKAIYATDIPSIAIFHAITREGTTGWIKDGEKLQFEADEKGIENLSNGYVYIFKKSDFIHQKGIQFISEEKRIPTHKILVYRNDFTHEISLITLNKK